LSDTAAPVFELDGLVIRYDRFTAIDGLDATIAPGPVGLLGPNGAGKSSLIKAALGLVKPAAGSIRVLGFEVPRQALEVRRRVGYMPENAVVFPGMTGFENVAYAGLIAGMPRGEARRRAHEVLEYVGAGEERYRDVDEYSQGMRQRIKLASALVHDPSLLMLDEPTNGLDPAGRAEILALIRDLGHVKGINVLFSSHVLDDVEAVCDSILLLVRGRLRAAGTIAQLKERFAGDRVRLTLDGGAREFVEAARGRGIDAIQPDPLDADECLVRLEPGTDARLLLSIALERRLRVRRFVPRRTSLEEVFLDSLEESVDGAEAP
jgi:ABC-2 type transport system ATP-binding protein